MASAWLGRGVGRGVRTRGGLGRGRGVERRYFRSDSNMFSVLSDPTTLSDTDGENSDTDGLWSDTNDGGFTTVGGKNSKSKRRRVSSGGRSDNRHVNDPVQGHVHDLASTRDTDTDTDFDTLSSDAKLSMILAKVSLNEGKVERIEHMLSSVVRKQKRISEIETVIRSHDDRLRMLEYKSLDVEARSRRNNLLIYGIAERRGENCVDRILGFLENDLGLETMDGTWIERAHRLGRYDKTKASRPIIVAFSSYRYIEIVMANVYKLKDTNYSVNRDFPAEITKARKLLWPKLKHIRQQFPFSKAALGYPAKIIVDGRTVEDMFPEWEDILRGSRVNASHPSQQIFKSARPGPIQPEQDEVIEPSQSLLPQQPTTPVRPLTVDFDINDVLSQPQSGTSGATNVSLTEPMEQGRDEFVHPSSGETVNSGCRERESRPRTRATKIANRKVSQRSRSSSVKSAAQASKSVSRSVSRVRDIQREVSDPPPRTDGNTPQRGPSEGRNP